MRYGRNLKLFYITHPFSNLHFLAPVLPLIFLAKGFTYTQIVFALVTMITAFQFALEVPSGYFADKFGHKRTFILANILASVLLLLYVFLDTYLLLLVAVFISGVSKSLYSGPDDALIYNTCKAEGVPFRKYFGRMYAFSLFLFALTSIAGGYLFALNPTYPLYAAFVFICVSIVASFFIQSPPLAGKDTSSVKFTNLKKTFALPRLRWIVLYFALIVGSLFMLHLVFLQEYLQSLVGVIVLGFLFSGYRIIQGLASLYNEQIEKLFSEKFFLFSLPLLVAVILIFNSYLPLIYVFFGLIYFSRGILHVYLKHQIQEAAPAHLRATTSSLVKFVQSIYVALAGLVFGYLADMYALSVVFIVLGIFLFVVVVAFYFSRRVLGSSFSQ